MTLIPTYSGGGEPFYEVSKDVEVIYLAAAAAAATRRKGLTSYVTRLRVLRALITERKPDVVVSFLPNVNVAAIISLGATRIPLIICERSDPTVQSLSVAWLLACKGLYRFADMLTVQTPSLAETIKGFFPGVRRIRSIANPFPEGAATTGRSARTERKILLSMGRLADEKQVERIIQSFDGVAREFPEWDLHIYGEGPLRPVLEALARRLGLETRVFFQGRTGEPWKVMANADMFVMASKYEGFPNSLLEAMGIGLPCVAFDCPSGPFEISNGGQDAVLVRLNDQQGLLAAMRSVMGDEALREELGQRARSSVLSRFGLSTVIAGWDAIFREVQENR